MSAATAKTADPSMEEILASIRRIIADDDDSGTKASTPPREKEAASAESAPANDESEPEDVLDLASVEDALTQSPDLEVGVPDISFDEGPRTASQSAQVVPSSPEPAPVEAPKFEAPPAPVKFESPAAPAYESREPARAAMPARPIEPARSGVESAPVAPVSSQPRTAAPSPVEAIISQEATASVGQAFGLLSHTIMSQNATTLEDIVREMLKPMLKTWLDDNLPPLVERLVAAEIQRVARGQR